MSQVHISDGRHTVTVTQDNAPDLGYLVDKTRALWEATRPAESGPLGGAAGFVTETRWQPHTDGVAVTPRD